MDQTAKYLTLVHWVKEKVQKNELKTGDKLYSENELARIFDISRQTVRHGISVLEHEDIVERRQGSGTYIKGIETFTSGSIKNIAVVITYVNNYIFPNIIKGIEDEAAKVGYNTSISLTGNSQEKERIVLSNLLDKGDVDGIIIEPVKSALPNPNTALYAELKKRNIPMIFINCYYPNMEIEHVSMNDSEVGRIAVKYLVNAGHHNIAGIFKSDDYQGHLRYSGFCNGLQEHNLKALDENVLWLDTEDQRYIDDNAGRILRRLHNCTACLCYNDEIAVKVVDVCMKNGIQIPDQLSVISVDNSYLAELCEVPLTSVGIDFKQIGRTAARNLLRLIHGNEIVNTVEITPEIKERMSVAKLE